MIAKECRKIHRPDCTPENRSPLCYCQTRKAETPVESKVWKELGYESPEAYMEWLKKISSRDTPFFSRAFRRTVTAS
jgi:hypothetical protein